MDRNFPYPYVLLVNVTIAELQGLRDKAEEFTRKFGTKHQVVERNEAVFFCFEKPGLAVLFEYYCFRNQIPRRRIGDENWMRAR